MFQLEHNHDIALDRKRVKPAKCSSWNIGIQRPDYYEIVQGASTGRSI